jgi:hypothetical protein
MRRATKRGPGPSHLLITPDRAGNVLGIDPHKQTLTATVVDPRGGVMLGFKSLEQKLRDGNGRTAPATVLELEKGKSLNWKNETGPHGTGNYVEEGINL